MAGAVWCVRENFSAKYESYAGEANGKVRCVKGLQPSGRWGCPYSVSPRLKNPRNRGGTYARGCADDIHHTSENMTNRKVRMSKMYIVFHLQVCSFHPLYHDACCSTTTITYSSTAILSWLQLVQQCCDDPRARTAQRVAKSNCTTTRVNIVDSKAQYLTTGQYDECMQSGESRTLPSRSL